jgi:hypothetical protein
VESFGGDDEFDGLSRTNSPVEYLLGVVDDCVERASLLRHGPVEDVVGGEADRVGR